MKRFIPPNELARDRRFKRANSKNQLLRSLPDDVDTIVEVLEKVGPKLRERVRGTALEAHTGDRSRGARGARQAERAVEGEDPAARRAALARRDRGAAPAARDDSRNPGRRIGLRPAPEAPRMLRCR